MSRISTFAKSPQAKRLASRAQGVARSPATKRRVEDVRRRLARRREP